MSLLSKVTGVHVKVPGLAQVGGVVDKAINNPIVDTIGAGLLGATGVGAPAAAAILAATKGLGTAGKTNASIGDVLSNAAQGAISGYGGDKLGAGLANAFSGGGATGLAKAAGSAALGKATGGGASGGYDNSQGDYDLYGNPIAGDTDNGIDPSTVGAGGTHLSIPGLPTGASDALDAAGSYLKNNAGTLLPLGLGVASGVNAANLQKQSSDALKQGLATAQGSYDARAPLRALGIAQLQSPTLSSDISGLGTMNAAGNPFARGTPIKLNAPPGAAGLAKPVAAVA